MPHEPSPEQEHGSPEQLGWRDPNPSKPSQPIVVQATQIDFEGQTSEEQDLFDVKSIIVHHPRN